MKAYSKRKFTRIKPLVYFLLLHVGVPVFSQTTYTWDGGGSNTHWETAENWSTDVVPASGDYAVFDATNCAPCTVTTSLAGARQILRITVNDGADVTLDLNMNINSGTSNIASVIILGTGNINFGVAGSNRIFTINLGTPVTASAIIANGQSSPSMLVTSSTTLTIQNSGNGIQFTSIDGDIVNDGTINITAAIYNGLRLDGNGTTEGITFVNNGILTISSAATRSIWLTNGGANFSNTGTVTLSNSATTCIDVEAGVFTNTGAVTINANSAATAISLSGGTLTHSSGTIDVNDATTQAIFMSEGTFNNNSSLDLTSCASTIGLRLDGGSFNNTSTIDIPSVTGVGIDLRGGSLANDGTINIATTGVNGLRLFANVISSFLNNSTGVINISNATTNGIILQDAPGSFTNDGTITISSPSTRGIFMQGGTFTTSNGASVAISNATTTGILLNGGSFTNDGNFTVTASVAQGIRLEGTGVRFPSFNNTSNGNVTIGSATIDAIELALGNGNGSVSNAGALNLTTTISPDPTDNLLHIEDSFTNSGSINLIGDGTGTGDQILVDIRTGGNLSNSGTIAVSTLGGDYEQVIQVEGMLTNSAGATVNTSTGRIAVLSGGTFTNNGLTRSSHSTAVGIATGGTATNNAFYSFAGGADNVFATGAGTITDNGIDVDDSTNTTFDLTGTTDQVADVGIDVGYDWYSNTDQTGFLGSNTASGAFHFDHSVEGLVASITAYTVYGSAVTFSFTNVLPVKLLYFSAKTIDTGVQLDWSTATELNNDRFEIYRSTDDGMSWDLVHTIRGNGTTTVRQEYHWTDPLPQEGINYYRLRQVDVDGTSETFRTIFAIWSAQPFKISAFPNPVKSDLHFSISGTIPRHAIRVFDVAGNQHSAQWTNNNSLDMSTLPNGVYLVTISLKGFQKSWRIVKE